MPGNGVRVVNDPGSSAFLHQLRRAFHLVHIAADHVRLDLVEGCQQQFACRLERKIYQPIVRRAALIYLLRGAGRA